MTPFDIQNYFSFIAAVLVFQLIPGPGTIAILHATARSGRAAGMAAVGGTLCGDAVYMLAAVAGLAAVMQAHPLLFEGLQWLGAGSLCWMGIGLLRVRLHTGAPPAEPVRTPLSHLQRAFAVSLTNPKVILFFVSFFPLFLRPDASAATLVAMIVHVTLISLVYQTLLVWLGNAVARRLRGIPAARLWATRLAGVALIGFGIRLAAGNR